MSAKDKTEEKSKVQDIIQKYRKAGKISIEAKKLAAKLLKPGANTYHAAQEVEQYIRDQGAIPAFPINISIDNEAAHYSPEILDDRVIPEKSIIKVDLGAHIDGYIVDTALTLNYNPEYDNLAAVSNEALDAVIAVAKAGVKIEILGTLIERIITSAGYEPVRNLSGHQIKRYILHAGVSIPNCGPGYFEKNQGRLQAGRIYAVEPFATNGKGIVKNGKYQNIFRFVGKPSAKQRDLIPAYNALKPL
ncbi:MAG: M24 family metallopeptidase, partial [Candidatus Kariarchaeaceae archaeon]